MSKFIKNNFFKAISSLVKSEEKDSSKNLESDKKEVNQEVSFQNSKIPKKIWKKEYNPLRKIVLWGWDGDDNPSFVIFYGKHEFKNIESGRESIDNILEDDVKYTSYAIFKGQEGHLPSFQAIKIIEESGYGYNRNKDNSPEMYFKKGIKYDWYWNVDKKYLVKEFKNLEPEDQVVFPYFVSQSHEEYVEKIEKQGIKFSDFRLAKNPNEVLKLNEQFTKYYEIINDMMSYDNLYIRRKRLNELLNMNPPKEVYNLLLNIGSTELISGLFLELARRNNPILIEEAKTLIESKIKWAEDNYIKGVKRCANIYLNALDKKLKADRIEWIRKSLSDMDLNIIKINGKDIPSDKIIEGSAYRKYAVSGFLMDYYGTYDYEQGKYVEYEAPKRYKEGKYTDGRILKLIDFKNTIQESEIYGLADVIGKIAYYLDAPRLTYYFKGSARTKQLKYFHRYIRRIINSYAESDPDKFMEAMKQLLTSYTEHDYVCKFHGNFQFNEFIKYYLYYDFKEKPPVGWDNWYEREIWMSNDQLMRLEGRYEFMKEIWDNHLDVVVDIAIKSKVNQIVKACYYILKDSPNRDAFIENMSYKQLINLTLVPYKPLAEMFRNILEDKLNNLNTFEAELMISLIGCPDKKMQELAMEFFNRTQGLFSPSDTADLLFLDNIDKWKDLFKQNLFSLEKEQYVEFIRYIINNANKFKEAEINLPENIRNMLSMSTDQIKHISNIEKTTLLIELISLLIQGKKVSEWMETFIEEIIFAFSYEELESLLKDITIEPAKSSISSRNRQVISVLESIKNRKLLSDSEIISILETGTSKMIKMLFSIITQNTEELNNRFSTLLIMLESEVTVLNKKVEEIFDNMPQEKQKKLHGIIIDSPVFRTYSFGLEKLNEIYGDLIPEEFIIQMLEHTSPDVKAYISDKTNEILDNLGNGNEKIFMYYIKTLLLLPNRISKSKERVYKTIPRFVNKHKDKLEEVENMLLDIGGSNIIMDSERALIVLAKIRGEVM
ncbi:hypothetical protein [Clostridium brassicae]|uniref:Uncharacterized protein n=1 Tax=Clostridium brassicae TaxID=2999072 RepID=A0ABT4D9M2_9CLOT|nr:hypothetical protein [Clostridium brassicae]MCY6959008.1 hypothetical protein [Clostridium brassicae]